MSETIQIFGEQFDNVNGLKAYRPDGTEVIYSDDESSINRLINCQITGNITINPTKGAMKKSFFDGCAGITGITQIHYAGSDLNTFANCTNMKYFFGPLSIGSSSFYNDSNLETLVSPTSNFCNIWDRAFKNCGKLHSVDIWPSESATAQDGFKSVNTFENCSSFKNFIIRRTSQVYPLNNTNNFDSSPFASNGTGGTLYVPQALITAYQEATNWSIILAYENNQILPIEGSIYETQYADGTPIVE